MQSFSAVSDEPPALRSQARPSSPAVVRSAPAARPLLRAALIIRLPRPSGAALTLQGCDWFAREATLRGPSLAPRACLSHHTRVPAANTLHFLRLCSWLGTQQRTEFAVSSRVQSAAGLPRSRRALSAPVTAFLGPLGDTKPHDAQARAARPVDLFGSCPEISCMSPCCVPPCSITWRGQGESESKGNNSWTRTASFRLVSWRPPRMSPTMSIPVLPSASPELATPALAHTHIPP